MYDQKKDPLARFLFSFVVHALMIIIGLMILGTFMGGVGMVLGVWAGSFIDAWLGISADSRIPGPFALLGVLVGAVWFLVGFFLLSKIEEWAALKEKCFAWRFLDDVTDLISAVIRGMGSIVMSAGLGAMVGMLVMLAIFVIEWYCHRVGIPFPTLSLQFWHTLIGYWAFVGVLWQSWREGKLVVQRIQP